MCYPLPPTIACIISTRVEASTFNGMHGIHLKGGPCMSRINTLLYKTSSTIRTLVHLFCLMLFVFIHRKVAVISACGEWLLEIWWLCTHFLPLLCCSLERVCLHSLHCQWSFHLQTHNYPPLLLPLLPCAHLTLTVMASQIYRYCSPPALRGVGGCPAWSGSLLTASLSPSMFFVGFVGIYPVAMGNMGYTVGNVLHTHSLN